MKILFISAVSISILIIVLVTITISDGNSSTTKTSNVNYPVKIHVLGVDEGESITFYTDGGLSQSINKSSFLINFTPGNHTLCISSSGNLWGFANIVRNSNPLIQDVYINVSSENKPCQNNK